MRPLTPDDAAFIVELLNDPSFIRNIGDRGVRTEEDARRYIIEGPMSSYARHGFGLCAVDLADAGVSIGICGLLQRNELSVPDIGFAFLSGYRAQGYAREAAAAVLDDARMRLGLESVLAIVNPDNTPSIRLLERLGFQFERLIRLGGEGPELQLFARPA